MNKFQVFGVASRIMLIGELVHKIFQQALIKNLQTFKDIEDFMKSELSSTSTVKCLIM